MNNVRTIYLDWYNGSVRATGGSQLAYQYDHLSNLVIFENAPKLDNYYLIVEMKETEDGEVRTFEPIQLAGSFWLVPNVYTQLAQNISFQVCCKTENGDFERHSAQFTGTILPSKDHAGAELDIDPSIMYDPYKQWVSDIAMAAGAIVIDPTLSIQGAAADAKAVGDRIAELEQGGTGGLTADIKTALLACFNHVAWDAADPTGQSYINALQTALYPPANLSRITAVYTQSGTVWSTDTLDSLRTNLVVTAIYDNGTSEAISNYNLSGTLSEGTRTITVSYGNKTATFNVVVTRADNSIYNWDFTSSLVDSKQDVEAVLTGATRDSNGVTFNALSDFISLCDVSAYNTGQFTVEIDFGDFIATAGNQYPVCLATGTGFTTYNGVASQSNGWMIYRTSNTKKYFASVAHDVFDNATLKFVYDISGENVWRVYADDLMIMEDTAPHSNLNNRKRLGIAFLPANSIVKAVRVYAEVV